MAKSLNEQAQEILKIAQESGVQGNFFFITTFKRYQVQLNMLTELENYGKNGEYYIDEIGLLEILQKGSEKE